MRQQTRLIRPADACHIQSNPPQPALGSSGGFSYGELLPAMSRTSDHRITIRLTPEEYAVIEAAAGDTPKSAFLRQAALAQAAKRRNTAQRVPAETTKVLAKILALLMAHPLVAQFKRAAKTAEDQLELDDDLHTTIQECHAFLKELRNLLLDALRGAK